MSPAYRQDNEDRKRRLECAATKLAGQLLLYNLPHITPEQKTAVYEYAIHIAHRAVEQDRRWRARRK